jgi:myo-inositol-1(or 4)-monophosphatase
MGWVRELEVLNDAIRAAGAEALRVAADGFETITKPDQSPVTSADLAVNDILHTQLLSAFPHDGWLSEESPDDPGRLRKDRVWVVDPIDGTKAFIKKVPEFCISVALIEEGHPIVAAIYNPSTDELFSAIRGEGLRLNHGPADARQDDAGQLPVMVLSPWERQIGRFATLDSLTQHRPMLSIAWSLALMACNRIDAVATFEPENEWDVAAGVLLINEAGGTITDGNGQALTFNRPTPRYRGIIAISPCCPDSLRRELASLVHTSESRTA